MPRREEEDVRTTSRIESPRTVDRSISLAISLLASVLSTLLRPRRWLRAHTTCRQPRVHVCILHGPHAEAHGYVTGAGGPGYNRARPIKRLQLKRLECMHLVEHAPKARANLPRHYYLSLQTSSCGKLPRGYTIRSTVTLSVWMSAETVATKRWKQAKRCTVDEMVQNKTDTWSFGPLATSIHYIVSCSALPALRRRSRRTTLVRRIVHGNRAANDAGARSCALLWTLRARRALCAERHRPPLEKIGRGWMLARRRRASARPPHPGPDADANAALQRSPRS